MIRTLHVIDSLGPGGAERSLADMLPLLRDRGVESIVVCLTQAHEGFHGTVVDSGTPVIVLSAPTRSRRIVELHRIIQGRQPAVVHTTLFEADQIGRLAAGRAVPVLTSLVNTSYEPARLSDPNVSTVKLRAAQAIDAFTAWGFTNRFHAITEAVKRSAVRRLRIRPDRITVIPRGKDPKSLGQRTEARRRDVRRKLGFNDDVPVLLNVGRREYQKGQVHLIEAAAHMRAACPDAVWLIAGREGNASRELNDLRARSGLEDVVRFLGHRDDVPDLLAAADLFVFPSIYEGLGGALLEAMGLGVPIVASDIPAVREVTGTGAARLVPAAQPAELADAAHSLLVDRATSVSLGSSARTRFLDRFTLEQVVERMLALLEETAGLSDLRAGP